MSQPFNNFRLFSFHGDDFSSSLRFFELEAEKASSDEQDFVAPKSRQYSRRDLANAYVYPNKDAFWALVEVDLRNEQHSCLVCFKCVRRATDTRGPLKNHSVCEFFIVGQFISSLIWFSNNVMQFL